MPSIEDWINHPLGIIETLFVKNSSYDSSLVKKYFGEKLQGKNSLSWIPSINDTPLHELRANSLVRYRCMIQDMYDPEFFLGAYEVQDSQSWQTSMRSGKYKDVAECGANQKINVESDKNVTMDRMTMYCVPVAGETEWVKRVHADSSRVKTRCMPTTSKVPQRSKRGLDEESDSPSSTTDSAMECNHGNTNGDNASGDATMETEEVKRQQTERQSTTANTTSSGPDLNFPLPGEVGPACLVKIYEDTNGFKVNDMVEFVGVLSVDPSLAHFHKDSSADGEDTMMSAVEETPEELQAHAPPPSLVPRLHAVLWYNLQHINPLVPKQDTEEYTTVLQNMQNEVTTLRADILSVLEHACLGDKLAAEYLLCHILSTIYARSDVVPLGKFTVNLTNSPASTTYAELLHHLLSNLVTQSHLLHMSLDNMNRTSFSPHKDYTANRLCSGMLQLAAETNLILNETALQPGQLDANGVRNLQALGNLISWQKVEYDFSYHKQDFMANVSTLVLSEGKSILPSDCLLPMKVDVKVEDIRAYFTQLDPKVTDDFLTKCRTYIGLARHLEYNMADDMQTKAQEDFVAMRKDDPKSMSIDDFHALLCLTRLLSVSHLKSTSTLDMWNRAKVMERLRRARVAETPQRSTAAS